jgi:hypothetical protein
VLLLLLKTLSRDDPTGGGLRRQRKLLQGPDPMQLRGIVELVGC